MNVYQIEKANVYIMLNANVMFKTHIKNVQTHTGNANVLPKQLNPWWRTSNVCFELQMCIINKKQMCIFLGVLFTSKNMYYLGA